MPAEREDLLDFKRINSALEEAFLVSVIAKKSKPVERLKRAEISEDLGMLAAMDKYIQNSPELVPLSEELKTYAQELERELEGNDYTP